jgi:hypothetical protein
MGLCWGLEEIEECRMVVLFTTERLVVHASVFDPEGVI